MAFSITLKQGDTKSFRFPVLEPKSSTEIWAEAGNTGGIDSYWQDFASWVAGGGSEDTEEFLKDRAPNIVRNKVVNLTGFSVRCHMRSGGQKIADLDVRIETVLYGGMVIHFPATQTQQFNPGSYTAQIEFTKGDSVFSSEAMTITVEGDVTYD